MYAHLNGQDVEQAIDEFFRAKYPDAAEEVKALMEPTEEILKKTIYANGYYFTELSLFPTLNHCKNHFYFEMMRENCQIASDEWFIPRNWDRGALSFLLEEKESAAYEAGLLYERLIQLQERIEASEYQKLWVKFTNLKLVTQIWKQLVKIFMDYAKYFETGEDSYEKLLEQDIDALVALKQQGVSLLDDAFYCLQGDGAYGQGNNGVTKDYIDNFAREIRESFRAEKDATLRLRQEADVVDFIVCGGAMEGHKLQKEVNFSDTLVKDGALCRIPGNRNGMIRSDVNAHGWFSYELCVKPQGENVIRILMGSIGDRLDVKITIGEEQFMIREEINGKREIMLPYMAKEEETVRIRFDKISGHTPCVYVIKVL